MECLADAIDDEKIQASSLTDFVLETINFGARESELAALGSLVNSLEVNDITDATIPFVDLAHNFMDESLDELFEESVVFGDGEDLDASKRNLINMIEEKFTSWNVSPSNKMIDQIVDTYDLSSRMKRYFDEDERNYLSPRAEQNRVEVLDIDDLFSRDR